MIVLILVVLILMNGIGYFTPAAPAVGYRYGNGALGLLCLILLVLMMVHVIPATF